MIYLDGLDSIIECVYLDESINDKNNLCDIFVNPENIKYLTGKVIIINKCEYGEEKIKLLIENRNKVITRVYFDTKGVLYRPYILRICKNVNWNGKYFDSWSKDTVWENMEFDMSQYKLYFPKLDPRKGDVKLLDERDNFSSLGWILQQVGVNIIENTPFKDLDLIKTGKIIKE